MILMNRLKISKNVFFELVQYWAIKKNIVRGMGEIAHRDSATNKCTTTTIHLFVFFVQSLKGV